LNDYNTPIENGVSFFAATSFHYISTIINKCELLVYYRFQRSHAQIE